MIHSAKRTGPYGLIAEFDSAEALLEATQKTTDAGYRKVETYSPFPIHGISEALKFYDQRVPWTVFFGGLIGATAGLGLQTYASVVDYPHNTGGKPFFSLPSFFPVTFECTILLAAFGAVFGMLFMNKLPLPYHPVFNASKFHRASQDRFFLCIEAVDPKFEAESAKAFLEALAPLSVEEVPY